MALDVDAQLLIQVKAKPFEKTDDVVNVVQTNSLLQAATEDKCAFIRLLICNRDAK